MSQYSVNIVQGSYMAIDHMPAGAISIFFFLVLIVNPLLKIIKRPWAFFPGELLLIFIMMFTASSVTEMGFGSQILPIISGASYYASPENNWGKLILPHLKNWLVVNDPQAVRYFYEGLPRGMKIPYGAWIKPLAAWMPYMFLLYFVMICIMVIFRKEWIEKERLVYPLTRLPLEMVKEDGKKTILPAFFRNPFMWLGFGIAFAFCTINALHNYFHLVPQIKLVNSLPIFRGTNSLPFRISFPVIGFVYLVNLEVSFSLWFFSLLFTVMRGMFDITGISTTENIGIYGCAGYAIFGHLGFGAIITYAGYNLFVAKEHLKDVWRSAIGKKIADDSNEILSYKTAFWGLLIGMFLLTFWLVLSGMSWTIAFLFLLFALVIFFVLTRIICEAGIPTFITPLIASSAVISIFGSKAIGAAGMVALALTYVYSADIRTFLMSPVGQSLRIAEDEKEGKRLLFWAIMAAVFVTIAVSLFLVLRLSYRYGGINLNGWYFGGNPRAPFSYTADLIKNPTGSNAIGWVCRTAGLSVMALLIFIRQRFLWWPIHPIGFPIGMVNWINMLWFSIFIAWLIKKLVLRYGGASVYYKLMYFFLGLPLGTYTAAGIWVIIDLFTGKQGNQVFWI